MFDFNFKSNSNTTLSTAQAHEKKISDTPLFKKVTGERTFKNYYITHEKSVFRILSIDVPCLTSISNQIPIQLCLLVLVQ